MLCLNSIVYDDKYYSCFVYRMSRQIEDKLQKGFALVERIKGQRFVFAAYI
jgi:hypothetical protein